MRYGVFIMEKFGFLNKGDKVVANMRITDTGEITGIVVAEKGDAGECIYGPINYWPTVRFQSGKATLVSEVEVTKI